MSQKTALVLDDDRSLRTLLTAILEEKQFQVTAFADPLLYLDTLGRGHNEKTCPGFDIVLTDSQMPGMTGLEFLEKIRSTGCQIPAHRKAIISGDWQKQDLEQARSSGFRIFHKPCPIDQIYAWLDEVSGQNS
ncbi:MAG: response regulator [Desulfuromusa sp.]|jgi:CheY-like chemotaxis protein|nr:response regulator [Desulfuromusa sp.]